MKKRKSPLNSDRNLGQPSTESRAPSFGDFIPYGWAHGISGNYSRELTVSEVKERYKPAESLGGNQDARLAMDAQLEADGCYSLLAHTIHNGTFPGGSANFMGYGALQQIAQSGLVRACIETVADDMTRNWIELKATDYGRQEDDDRLQKIEQEFERLNIRETIHHAAELTGYYGGTLLFIETRNPAQNLLDPLVPGPMSAEAGEIGWLKGVKAIDPVNIFPGTYNTSEPLSPTYYKPTFWWILSQQAHASRFLRVVANEPPLLMLPNYNFLGIPQAQILWDYISHFQANRDSVNRIFKKFSMLVFKTSFVGNLFNGGALSEFDHRMLMLAKYRDNDSVVAIDNDTEDIVKIETPISGLTDIPRQSLEFVAALNRTPVVKLLGISPSGFNATGESDLRNYYDHIKSQQEKILRRPLQKILEYIQLSLFGDIDRSIKFDFCPLSEEDESKQASTQQIKINNLCSLLDRDVITPEEARKYLINDPDSGLNDLDPDAVLSQEDEGSMADLLGGMGMQGEEQKPLQENPE